MELNLPYFYTVAIVDWMLLLKTDKFKIIVLESLAWLVNRKKIKIYGFVIMPNHIHILWENTAMNGKEMPYVSFMKIYRPPVSEELRKTADPMLNHFAVNATDRDYQFWQKDGMAKIVGSQFIAEQKLNYMHSIPCKSTGTWLPILMIIIFRRAHFMKEGITSLIG